MTANELIRKMKWKIMLSSMDIPIKVNGKEVVDVEVVEDDEWYYNLMLEEK